MGAARRFSRKRRGARTPGDGIRKEKRGSGTYYVRAHLCSSGSGRAAVRVLLHSLTSDRRAAMPSFSLTPRRQKFGRTRRCTRGRPAGFRESAEVQDSWRRDQERKRGSGTYYVRAHLCSSGSGRAAVRVLLHSLTSDRRAAMPSFSLTPRRQKFGRARQSGHPWVFQQRMQGQVSGDRETADSVLSILATS